MKKQSQTLFQPLPSKTNTLVRVVCMLGSILIQSKRRVLLTGKALVTGQGEIELDPVPSYIDGIKAWARCTPARTIAANSCFGKLLKRLILTTDEKIKALITVNATVVFFGTYQGERAVMHCSLSAQRACLVRRHAHILQGLNGTAKAPRFIALHEVEGHTLLVQERLVGDRIRPTNIVNFLSAAVVPLAALIHSRPEDGLPVIRPSLHVLPEHIPTHAKAIRIALHELNSWAVQPVPCHGDYGFHNILMDGDCLSGVVDWDRFFDDGYPLFDAYHLLMIHFNESGVCDNPHFIMALWNPKDRHAKVCAAIDDLQRLIPHGEGEIRKVGLALWLTLIHFGYIETSPPDNEWYGRVIAAPAQRLTA